MLARYSLLLGILLAAAPVAVPPAGAGERVITVFAAASLTDALRALAPEFAKASGGVKLRNNLGASSALRTQIEQGAPADVFASADREQMEPLVRARRVETPVTFARNRLVFVTPLSNPAGLRSLKDLGRPGLRLVATSEAVPVGKYTREILERLARRKEYGRDFPRRVTANVVSREPNVRGLLAKVELGEADAAFVYETDARASKRVRTFPIPEAVNVVAEYPIAIVTGAAHRPDALAFVRFVRSARGQAVLRRCGFR